MNGIAQRACTASSGPLTVIARGHNFYLRRAAGEISDATPRDFRARLFRMETDGCLASGGAQRGAAALDDLLALPSSSLYLARYGVEATASGANLRLASVQRNRGGKAVSAVAPAGLRLESPGAARNFRVLFLRRRSDSDRNLTLLGAGSRAELEAAEEGMEFAADPMAACRDERSAWCQPISWLSAIAPVPRVMVNGKSVFVGIRGTASEAIQTAGLAPQGRTWVVERSWRGRLLLVEAAARPEALLDLVLLGGERITASTH